MRLIKYLGSNIQGECIICDEFTPVMNIINDSAKTHGLIVVITSSKRNSTIVPGAIVEPAKMGNHFVGHAIDCNLKCPTTGEYFNSVKMGDKKGKDQEFIDDVKAKGIRYGGDFHTADDVHFDDSLNLKDPSKWHELNKLYNGVPAKDINLN